MATAAAPLYISLFFINMDIVDFACVAVIMDFDKRKVGVVAAVVAVEAVFGGSAFTVLAEKFRQIINIIKAFSESAVLRFMLAVRVDGKITACARFFIRAVRASCTAADTDSTLRTYIAHFVFNTLGRGGIQCAFARHNLFHFPIHLIRIIRVVRIQLGEHNGVDIRNGIDLPHLFQFFRAVCKQAGAVQMFRDLAHQIFHIGSRVEIGAFPIRRDGLHFAVWKWDGCRLLCCGIAFRQSRRQRCGSAVAFFVRAAKQKQQRGRRYTEHAPFHYFHTIFCFSTHSKQPAL